MDHVPAGSRPTKLAPSSYFTGTVIQDPIVEAPEPARVRATRVTFLPGARTNWHTHPLGQTLYVLSGVGRFQTADEKIGLVAEAIQKRVSSVALPNERAQTISPARAIATWQAVSPWSISCAAACSSAAIPSRLRMDLLLRVAASTPSGILGHLRVRIPVTA